MSSVVLSDFSDCCLEVLGTLPLAEAFPILSSRTEAWRSRDSRSECRDWGWSGRGPRRETRVG